jgi:hypothetical protein
MSDGSESVELGRSADSFCQNLGPSGFGTDVRNGADGILGEGFSVIGGYVDSGQRHC